MKTKDFFFELPAELIAQSPPAERGKSRLMVLDPRMQSWNDLKFSDFVDLVEPDTHLVFNDTKVRKARVFAQTENGGKVEAVFLQPFPENRWECVVNKAKKLKLGQILHFPENVSATIESAEGAVRILRFDREIDDSWLERNGHLPLPPYIKRPDSEEDQKRYQTIFARKSESAAAPTAGLHFTEEILGALRHKGVHIHFVTLRVGLGTFLPVRVEDVSEHRMHRESFFVSPETAEELTKAKLGGKTILSVGTTSLRTLESAWDGNRFVSGERSTDIFITPGYRFRAVDRLLTNFHTPESTLLMLVSAFAGIDLIKNAYRHAVQERYRFFSYGDAMLILNTFQGPSL